MRIPFFGRVFDERFLNHRLRSTSLGGIIGGVLALQTGPVLVERGLGQYVGGMVGISMCKELAPVMMAMRSFILIRRIIASQKT